MRRASRTEVEPPKKAKGRSRDFFTPRATKGPLAPGGDQAQSDWSGGTILDDDSIGLEGRSSLGDHQSLRLWLRLLSCSNDVETQIRQRLRSRFGMTLARFDYLAQLHRHPTGLRMNALSRFLMVTGGNVTGLTDELEKDGFVAREDDPDDRRSYRVALTAKGRKAFEQIAGVHEGWVVELLGGVTDADRQQLFELLGRLRVQLSAQQTD